MYYLSSFARPLGAKDKQERKKRGTLKNLALGTGVGAIGGLGTGAVVANHLFDKTMTQSAIDMGVAKNKKEVWKSINKEIAKDKTGQGKKILRKIKLDIFKGVAPTSVKLGAGIGLAGTGAYLGGRAIINKLRNKNVSERES